MTTEHQRGGTTYRRTSIDVPSEVKADIDKYGINVTQTSVAALEREIEKRKNEVKP